MPKSNTTCYICKIPIYRIPSRLTDHSVCSYACRNKYFSGQRSFIWRGGTQDKTKVRLADKQRRKKYKQMAVEYLGGSCKYCGYNRCIAALDFHHIDPLKKDINIKSIIGRRWGKIKIELNKCILLCSNCHREEHYKPYE